MNTSAEARLLGALEKIAADNCGCSPCTGQCRSADSLRITVDAMRDIAHEALSSHPYASELDIRRDEREKIAAEVESRNWPCVGDAKRIAASIRNNEDTTKG